MSTVADLVPALEGVLAADGPDRGWARKLEPLLHRELAGLALDEAWPVARSSLIEYLIDDGRPLGTQLPALQRLGATPIRLGELSTRLRNLLLRERITLWSELAALRPAELLERHNAGRTTVDEVLGASLDAASSALERFGAARGDRVPPENDYVSTTPGPEGEPSPERVDLQTLAAWAIRSLGASTVAQVLNPKLPVQALDAVPPEITAVWSRLAGIPLRSLADPELLDVSLDQLVSELLDQLSESQRLIATRRLLAVREAPTLDTLGQQLQVTRERVRQIQEKTRVKLHGVLRQPRYAPLLWAAHRLRKHLGGLALADDPANWSSLQVELERDAGIDDATVLCVLFLAGPYRQCSDWLVRQGVAAPAASLIEEFADEYGIVDTDALLGRLTDLPMSLINANRWVEASGLTRQAIGKTVLWQGGVTDKMCALLAAREEPADAETLVALVGADHSVRSSRQRLFDDERFVRVSKTHWALRAWGMEEYTGIVDELKQRIEEQGGSAPLIELVDEIVESFGVRDSSVRLYANAPMFVLEDGLLRLRRASEPYPVETDISGVRGCFVQGAELLLTIIVDHDVLRGSGRQCPPAVAGRLGVAPAAPRDFSYEGGQLSITWVASAGLGPSIGSTRILAALAGAKEGDRLLLRFSLSDSTVAATRIKRDLAGSTLLQAQTLCGLELSEVDPRASVARAIGVPPADVNAVLRRRGDIELADLLPSPPDDDDLDAALEAFGNMLDELES